MKLFRFLKFFERIFAREYPFVLFKDMEDKIQSSERIYGKIDFGKIVSPDEDRHLVGELLRSSDDIQEGYHHADGVEMLAFVIAYPESKLSIVAWNSGSSKGFKSKDVFVFMNGQLRIFPVRELPEECRFLVVCDEPKPLDPVGEAFWYQDFGFY